MRRAKQINPNPTKMTTDQAVQFVEDFRAVVFGQDSKTKAISLRVPENVLNAFKINARQKGQKYQSVVVQLMREWVSKTQRESGQD